MKSIKILQGRILTVSSLVGILIFSCTLSNHIPQKVGNISTPLITFVIPTVGRPTLERTLISLQEQSNPSWEAIVVFDGIPPTKMPADPRIKSIKILKTGKSNYGGEVRNEGMKQVKTEWIAFVDDDDYLSPDYLDRLVEEIRLNPSLDVVIFRMYHPYKEDVIPAPEDKNFLEGKVGISFSMKTTLYKAGFKFKPGPLEDFKLLDHIREQGYKMVLSPYVTYLVRGARRAEQGSNIGNCIRAYIN